MTRSTIDPVELKQFLERTRVPSSPVVRRLSSSSEGTASSSSSTGSTSTYYGTVSFSRPHRLFVHRGRIIPRPVPVTGTPSGLYAGASATLTITVKKLNTVVEVPTGAITYSNGNAQVTVVTGGKHVTRSVTTGQVSTGDTQITRSGSVRREGTRDVVTFRAGSGGWGSLLAAR